ILSSLPRPSSSTLFPYTTLFRSSSAPLQVLIKLRLGASHLVMRPSITQLAQEWNRVSRVKRAILIQKTGKDTLRLQVGRETFKRSEEHTSELQSRVDLVCRLLLE